MIFRKMLHAFTIAYNNKVLTVPIAWLQNILHYDNLSDLEEHLQACNLSVVVAATASNEEKQKTVKFEKVSFDTSKTSVRVRRRIRTFHWFL